MLKFMLKMSVQTLQIYVISRHWSSIYVDAKQDAHSRWYTIARKTYHVECTHKTCTFSIQVSLSLAFGTLLSNLSAKKYQPAKIDDAVY